jgi:NitT/TauT family transport system permease protein
MKNFRTREYLPAILFGAAVVLFWELVVRAFSISPILLPAPSAVWARFFSALPLLAVDFWETIVKAMIPGWILGSTAGLLTALVCDRYPFFRRGLLPLGNFVSVLPLVGIAPIMVMWFGPGVAPKIAVVVVMTFFPMLVNATAGLQASGHLERDLMRSYGSSWMQALLQLRLPAAMPFVFNALKINSTLALIGAIVSEFFGTLVVGMGFRIQTGSGSQSLDLVWAEIVVAAVTGSAFYGLLTLFERRSTFWHPSNRS